MSDLNVNSASFSISLNPPGAEGDPFSNSVTYAGGKPLGGGTPINQDQLLNSILGYTDSLSSPNDTGLAEIKALLAGINIGMSLINNMSPEQQVQLQIDTISPENPTAPIILKYVKLADDAIATGNLTTTPTTATGGTEAATAAGAAETAKTDAVAPKANKWLAGNAYTQFVVSYFELMKILKEMKEIDSKLELQGMAQVFELAKQTADTIMAAAKERAMMHIMQAVMAGVSMAFTLTMTAVSIYQTGKFKVEENGKEITNADGSTTKTGAWDGNKPMTEKQAVLYNKNLTSGALGTQTIQMGYISAFNSGAKAVDDIIQAIFEVRAAEYDALKELLQAYRTIAQQQMDKASEGFKSESDMITQLIQQLDQIRQKLHEAIAANMRRG